VIVVDDHLLRGGHPPVPEPWDPPGGSCMGVTARNRHIVPLKDYRNRAAALADHPSRRAPASRT
jgi:hypothetical protein